MAKENLIVSIVEHQNNDELFKLILTENKERVYYLVRRMVFDHHDADDLTQEIFVKVWKNLNKFESRAKVSTWVHRIAINHTLNFIEKEKRRKLHVSRHVISAAQQVAFNHDNPNADFIERKLDAALQTLPAKQLMVFNMRYYDDMSYNEISDVTGTTVGALKASYHLAAKKIESFLKND